MGEDPEVNDDDISRFLTRDYEGVVRVVTIASGDRQRAEDAVQDALVDVWTKRREVSRLAGWVTTAALNRARGGWRHIDQGSVRRKRW